MEERKLFSVLFCTGTMLLYFFGTIYDRTKSRRGLALLLQSFLRAPYTETVQKISLFRDHGYVIHLKQDILSATAGRSPLVLLEDGKPLPRPHARDGNEVADHGLGQYVHLNRRIFFSPSDNADLEHLNRRYSVLETLTTDPATTQKLVELNNRQAEFDNTGLWILAKLKAYLDRWIRLDSVVADGPNGVAVTDAVIDTAALDFGTIRVARATARWERSDDTWFRLDVALDTILMQGVENPISLALSLDFMPTCDLRLRTIRLTADGAPWADISLTWLDDRLDQARAVFFDLATIRRGLTAACGGNDAHCRWLGDMLQAIRNDDLSFGCRIDDAAGAALRETLAPDSTATRLDASIENTGGEVVFRCAGQ